MCYHNRERTKVGLLKRGFSFLVLYSEFRLSEVVLVPKIDFK